jgi:hypothetical protein
MNTAMHDVDLLCAIVILRFFEQLNVPSESGTDQEQHLAGKLLHPIKVIENFLFQSGLEWNVHVLTSSWNLCNFTFIAYGNS